MSRVLIVEDDAVTSAEISAALREHGFAVERVCDGRQGLLRAAAEDFEAIVLDRLLPGGLDGLGVLTAMRAAGVETPVLILSALSGVDERVRGLRAGGDDYLSKPFEAVELTARLDALLRRRARATTGSGQETRLRIGDLEMDLLKHNVTRGARSVDLLPREYALLEHLMQHGGEVVTRTMLFEAVWNYRYDERTNVIDVHISRLRRKVDAPGEPPLLHTVRGAGYVVRAPE